MGIINFLKRQKIDWYVKWTGSSFSLLTVFLTSADLVPYNKWSGLITAILWVTLGNLWRERFMIYPNLIFGCLYLLGLLKSYGIL